VADYSNLRKISDVRNDLLATFYDDFKCVIVDEDTVKFKHWVLFRQYTHTKHKHSRTNITYKIFYMTGYAYNINVYLGKKKTNTLKMMK
jgi:hypothetical protein